LKIGIIGLGHVGRSMIGLFGNQADLIRYDIREHGSAYPSDDLADCDYSVICVDTPMASDGSANTDNVYEAVRRCPSSRILIKSTIPPGTTDDLISLTGKQICFSPEYVGESTYRQSYFVRGEPSFVVLGGKTDVRQSFIDNLLPILGPDATYFQSSAVEAELIKYMENCFLAMKVSFVNEFFEICRVHGADWHTVREGWLLDPRVGRSHSAVFSGRRGFSGKCLPKDVNAIVRATRDRGYDPELLRAMLRFNAKLTGETLPMGRPPGLPVRGER
jgi:UDPglucose 6-dehydrogenase